MGKENGVQILPSPQQQAAIQQNMRAMAITKRVAAQTFVHNVMGSLDAQLAAGIQPPKVFTAMCDAVSAWLCDPNLNPFSGLAINLRTEDKGTETKIGFIGGEPMVSIEDDPDLELANEHASAVYSGKCLVIRLPIARAEREIRPTDSLIMPGQG